MAHDVGIAWTQSPGRTPDEPEWTSRRDLLRRLSYLMVLVVPILCLVVAIVVFWNTLVGPGDIALLVGLYITSALGVSVGYHRLLTHRSFRTRPAIRYALATLGTMAVEGPPTEWVATHRKHHAFADHSGDPHTPHGHGPGLRGALRGLAHAHAGWYLNPMPVEELRRYAPDMLADRGMRLIDRHQPVIIVSGLAIPFAIGFALSGSFSGAVSALVWGGLIRIFLVHHVTRSIDSICHFFGERRYASNDESRNVAWLSIISFGESYHNNHHAFPAAAYIGVRRSDVDIAGLCIKGLERCGLAWHVGQITPKLLARKLRQSETMPSTEKQSA
jgi:stearoyl-CoA desaturase (delta-9 desaturase)